MEACFIFKRREEINVTSTEFSWKNNSFAVKEGFLVADGLLNNFRVPLSSIDTVVWSRNPLKPELSWSIRIIGRGVILTEAVVPNDRINDVQDWILDKIK